MQHVSDAWKATHLETILPETFVELSYKVIDPGAQADAVAVDNGAVDISDVALITDDRDKDLVRYATLEHNAWLLDGVSQIINSVPQFDVGFAGDSLCDENCEFASNPFITITFTQKHMETIAGITIVWSESFDECARKFEVKVYDGATVLSSKLIDENTKNTVFVEGDLSGYDKVTIEVMEWCLPHRRARIEEVLLGVKVIFSKADLLGFEHEQSADMLSGELPNYKIVFSLQNVDMDWNPDNPEGAIKYLITRQEIKARFGMLVNGVVEWIRGGTFYMSEWQTPSNGILATFTASGVVSLMHRDFTTSADSITLYNLAKEAIELCNLPKAPLGGDRWFIDDALKGITITIPNDFKYSCAEVAQLCANAACCVFYQDRDGILRIEPFANHLTDYIISRHMSYANAEYDTDQELKSVSVNDGMGAASGGPSGEIQTMQNALIQSAGVANNVAAWARDCLMNRNKLVGEFRPDVRLDALDNIMVENKYASNVIVVTKVKYSYNGAFSGSYEGRVMT